MKPSVLFSCVLALALSACGPSGGSDFRRPELQRLLDDLEAAVTLRNDTAAEAVFTEEVRVSDERSVPRADYVANLFGYFDAFGEDTEARVFDRHIEDGDVIGLQIRARVDDAPRHFVEVGFVQDGADWLIESVEGVELGPLRLHNLGLDLHPDNHEFLFPLAGDYQLYGYGPDTNPNLEYIVNIESSTEVQEVNDVISPINGVVVNVGSNVDAESSFDDFHIHIRPTPDSPWQIELDHVVDPVVEAGDTVINGAALGKPSDDWVPWENEGRTEMQVNDDVFYWCPLLPHFWDAGELTTIKDRLTQMMQRWNEDDTDNEPGHYDIDKVLNCHGETTMTPEEFAD